MTKAIKRVSKADQQLLAELVKKYGVREVRRIVEKVPGRAAGRKKNPPQNHTAVWVAVEVQRANGMNITEALKEMERVFVANTNRKTRWQTLRGYYDKADQALKNDPDLRQHWLDVISAIGKTQELFGTDSVVIPGLLHWEKNQ